MKGFGPHRNFPVEVVQLQRWSSLAGWSGPTETCSSISKHSSFQSYFAGHNQSYRRKANGCFDSNLANLGGGGGEIPIKCQGWNRGENWSKS